MDVWAWVRSTQKELRSSGQGRLAEILGRLANATVNGRHDEVDSLAAEGLNLARASRRPWIEVFIRHWQLQSRTVFRSEGQSALTAAVEALDLAHQESTSGCPQAVCTVQDVAICYLATDGPGWAVECLKVIDEAMAGIDTAWPCWTCLSSEKASAMLYAGRPQEALDALDSLRLDPTVPMADKEDTTIGPRVAALLALRRYEELIEEADRYLAIATLKPKRSIALTAKAAALVRLGHPTAASDVVPTAEDMQRASFPEWAAVLGELVHAGARPNDSRLGSTLQRMVDDLESVGSWHRALQVADVHTKLAVQRGARWTAVAGANQMARLVENLRTSGGWRAAVAQRRNAADGLPRPQPLSDAELEEQLTNGSPGLSEADVDIWDNAYHDHPGDDRVACRYALVLLNTGNPKVAADLLRGHLGRKPQEESDPAKLLADIALREGDDSLIAELTSMFEPVAPLFAYWLAARRAHHLNRWAEAIDCCKKIIELDRDVVNTRRLWADAAKRAGDFAECLRVLEERRDLLSEQADDWQRIIAGTAVGEWAVVRAACARVGFDLTTTQGPIEEDLETLVLRYPRGHEVIAKRTGPVTARVVTVSPPAQPQRFGDVALFEPTLLEPRPEPIPEGWLPKVPFLHTLLEGNFVGYELMGEHPGAQAVTDLYKVIDTLGGGLWIWRGREWTVHGEDGSPVAGFAAMIALPPDGSLRMAHQRLTEWTVRYGLRFAWPALADAARDPTAAAEHRNREWLLYEGPQAGE